MEGYLYLTLQAVALEMRDLWGEHAPAGSWRRMGDVGDARRSQTPGMGDAGNVVETYPSQAP